MVQWVYRRMSDTSQNPSASRKLAAILAADIAGYSALMGADEARTVRDLKAHLAVIMPMVGDFDGRIVDTAGDGILAEFASAVKAAECAVAIQTKMVERNATVESDRRMRYRIGINVGDVIYDQARIYGDGVNVAARLEGIAEPGGILLSRQAYDQVQDKVPFAFRKLGVQTLKNIAKPVEVFAIDSSGRAEGAHSFQLARLSQEIKYCRTPDGVQLAYAIAGSGPPLVKTANWMNHLEYDWDSPVWRHVFRGLARSHTFIRYDARGNGMSDWEVAELSLDAWVSDLETVVDAAGLDTFPLLGISQGCAVSIAYAVRHPERVSHLILYGGFIRGAKKSRVPEVRDKLDAITTLTRLGWGQDNPIFRQIFTGLFMPDATHEQMDFFNELQRRSTSPGCAARYIDVVSDLDITELLEKVTTPTLVMHVRGDVMCPLDGGRKLAAGITGARLVVFPGRNHVFLEDDPASDRFFIEIEQFLRSQPA